MNKYLVISIFMLFCSITTYAQSWIEKLNDSHANFYEIQREFNEYWKSQELSIAAREAKGEKVKKWGYKQYKRWEQFVEPRVYPSGDLTLLQKGYMDYYNQHVLSVNKKGAAPSVTSSSAWKSLGPVNPTGSGAFGSAAGAGRVNCIRIHPTNSSIIYVGSAGGGLWKTTNGGTTWQCTTDHLPVLGISDIVINPLNPNIIFLASGDADGGSSGIGSIGLYKSIDAGATWQPSDFNTFISAGDKITRLIMNPINPNIMMMATTSSLYRSDNGGDTWIKVLSVSFRDMEFKPFSTKIIYGVTNNSFYRSVDAGLTFTKIACGAPANGSRLALGVTNADSNYVYILGGAGDYSFSGIFKSTDGGNTFSKQGTTPNILGNDPNGTSTGGQAWYDLAIAVSSADKETIFVGGVNVWKSIDGGLTFTKSAGWTDNIPTYIHADIHAIEFDPNSSSTLFVGCDGGFFKSVNTGSTYSDLSNGLQIAQMYRLGVSQTNAALTVTGWQDCGSSLYKGSSWSLFMGGDGMECFIDPTDANYIYGSVYYGDIRRSINGGSSYADIKNNISETGGWITPWLLDPNVNTTLYAGYENVWMSTNRGSYWTKISTFGTAGNKIRYLGVSPANSNHIYAVLGGSLMKTSNGGTSWSDIKPGLPAQSVSGITFHESDTNKLWVCNSGFSVGNKVFQSIDGGITWTNISGTLPNIPVNCIIYEKGSNDALYIGTDVGVFYKNASMADWVSFSNGLPSVIVDDIDIQYSSSKIRVATYGRGLWESPLFAVNQKPIASFNSNKTTVCAGDTVQFTDVSYNSPTAWLWSFPGGNPSTSTLQNPQVVYPTASSYNNVTLLASNANGVDSVQMLSYIIVGSPAIALVTPPGPINVCKGSVSQIKLTGNNSAYYTWNPGNKKTNFIYANTSGIYTLTVTNNYGCTASSAPVIVNFNVPPAVPTVTQNVDTLTSSATSGNQWFFNNTPLSGENNQTLVATQSGNYYVVVTDSNGCTAKSVTLVYVGIDEVTNLPGSYLNVYPNPSQGNMHIQVYLPERATYNLEIINSIGQQVYAEEMKNSVGEVNKDLVIHNLVPGNYLLKISSDKGYIQRTIQVQ